jgi:hypothetical protein
MFKFFRDLYQFFVAVSRSNKTKSPLPVNPNWWLTKNVNWFEDHTDCLIISACPFFWTAVYRAPIFKLADKIDKTTTTGKLIAYFGIPLLIYAFILMWISAGIKISLTYSTFLLFWMTLICLLLNFIYPHLPKSWFASPQEVIVVDSPDKHTFRGIWRDSSIRMRIFIIVMFPIAAIMLLLLTIIMKIYNYVSSRWCPILVYQD